VVPGAASVAFCGALAALSWARADGPVLHEFVADVDPDEPGLALAGDDDDPQAILHEGDVLLARERARPDDEPMVAAAGDGEGAEQPGRRSPSFRPDRQTQLEGTLGYQEAFNPSIAPFKRVSSLDATERAADGTTPLLVIHDARRAKVPIEGARARAPDARARDRFWGEAKLDFSQGRVFPFPSVSPESRILSLRTDPAIDLAIERDGADNFYAVLAGPLPSGVVFVSFLTDAPRSYFGAPLPDERVAALAAKVPPLESGIRSRALRFAAELGIGPATPLSAAVPALTAHFRAFEESSDPPDDSGDIYLDLARGRKGICRHRAYAFVVTAHALGLPARFVQNEAHSWVEIELPGAGWMRIDLGGAAHGLTAHGLDDRASYRPAEPDRLPRPRAYEESYSLMNREVALTDRSDVNSLLGRFVDPDASSALGPGGRDREPETGRAPVTIAIDQRDASVLRGGTLDLSGGIASLTGEPASGLRLEISLLAESRRERMLLGVTVSDARGRFKGGFDVPPDLPVGEYRLVVITPGSDRFLPGIAE
jgi:transglutaminase-like putative cysteine protease